MKTGIKRIADERRRQINREGFDAEHDVQHGPGDLAAAARCYALYAWWQLYPHAGWMKDQVEELILEVEWPWSNEWWKPSIDPRRNLEKAGALIAAELDAIDRRMGKSEPQPPKCSCCEYIDHCIGDPQKPDYCPDENYKFWLKLKSLKEK